MFSSYLSSWIYCDKVLGDGYLSMAIERLSSSSHDRAITSIAVTIPICVYLLQPKDKSHDSHHAESYEDAISRKKAAERAAAKAKEEEEEKEADEEKESSEGSEEGGEQQDEESTHDGGAEKPEGGESDGQEMKDAEKGGDNEKSNDDKDQAGEASSSSSSSSGEEAGGEKEPSGSTGIKSVESSAKGADAKEATERDAGGPTEKKMDLGKGPTKGPLKEVDVVYMQQSGGPPVKKMMSGYGHAQGQDVEGTASEARPSLEDEVCYHPIQPMRLAFRDCVPLLWLFSY